jgi:hypothetical protein
MIFELGRRLFGKPLEDNPLQPHQSSKMSNLEELKDALRDTLAARGSLGQIQARVRAEIFSALEETVSLAEPNSYLSISRVNSFGRSSYLHTDPG